MKMTAKRRRSKLQIKEEKKKEEREKDALAEKLKELTELKEQVTSMNEKMGVAAELHNQVQALVDDGVIKQALDGNLIEVEDPEEREAI